MITEYAKEEIRKKLRENNFPEKYVEPTLKKIAQDIEYLRRGETVWTYEGVARRLMQEYAKDEYQEASLDEMKAFFACACGKCGCDCEVKEEPMEEEE